MKFTLNIKRSEQLVNICGSLDKNLENLATNLDVDISNKGADFNIKGDNADKAVSVLQELLILSEKKTIDFSDIDLSIKSLSSPNGEAKSVTIKTSKKHIHIRSDNQQKYVNSIIENDAVFAIGPAGTGKTYLAVARAVEALENSNVKRIVLVRPAVEAGEKLGFLPGDLSEKVDPYLRPIYDALYEFIGFERVNKLIEKHVIEVAPLAFMRAEHLTSHTSFLMKLKTPQYPK
jgi:phosphate starvation-inducible PhoH-like protein